MSRTISSGLYVREGGNRKLNMTQDVWKGLGSPEYIGVAVDRKRHAVKLTPNPTEPIKRYHVYIGDNKPVVGVSLQRVGKPPMPDGNYGHVGGGVFVLEDDLDQRAEAKLARLFIWADWEERTLNHIVRQIRLLAQATIPDKFVCQKCEMPLRRRDLVDGNIRKPSRQTKWASIHCPNCGAAFWPQDGTIFPRSRKGMREWMYALYLLAKNPELTYRDFEDMGYSHSEAIKVNKQLREFLPKPGKYEWEDLLITARFNRFKHLTVRPKQLRISGRAWQALGRPSRINLVADPIDNVIVVKPDPDGAHSLNFHTSETGGVQATIASITDTVPAGTYEPVTLGRFEGVFKLEK